MRAALDMPERPPKAEINLTQHARNNGIKPSYDLPTEGNGERHHDNNIQTLLLPKDLERKLNGISSKCKTWIQETGINVLHVAYGFVEWSEPNQTETSFAPLILAAIEIKKNRTPNGSEFWISGVGDEPELNAVFAEKLKEFGIELPVYDGGPLEPYFATVTALEPKSITWKLRRQVAIGVFPSARMAMYHDLDPAHPAISESEIVSTLLAGALEGTALPFSEEYNVDEPDIERLVPYLVLDADSSQHSALVDIALNKNLAIEGPPGTGKSQTIVNAIAAALASGKKVLFVAEKLAALNVVKSRLEAIGIGEFLLPLQAERSTREQVVASLRARVAMDRPAGARDYEAQLEQFRRARAELAEYIAIITTSFAESGMTVHEILGKSIATAPRLDGIPADVLSECSIGAESLTKGGLQGLRDRALRVERAYETATEAGDSWRATQLTNADRFVVEDICGIATRGAQLFRRLGQLRDDLSAFGLDRDIRAGALEVLVRLLDATLGFSDQDRAIAVRLLYPQNLNACAEFVSDCEASDQEGARLGPLFVAAIEGALIDDVDRMASLCADNIIESLDVIALEEDLRKRREALASAYSLIEQTKPLIALRSDAAGWLFTDISRARQEMSCAGRVTLSLRSDMLANPAAREVLVRLAQECRALQATRSDLEKRVCLSAEASPEELREVSATLSSSSFLSIFLGSYRKAVRQARLLVPSQKFNKPLAAALINELAAFRLREREFLRNSQTTAVFGLHFRGVDTDLEPFMRLLAFYEAIDRHFAASDKRGLRQFLRDDRLEALELLPEVPAGVQLGTSETLQNDLNNREAEFAARVNAIDNLKDLVPHFRDPKSVYPRDLASLSTCSKSLMALRAKLAGATSVAELIGDIFQGWRTDTRGLKHICEWAADAPAYSNVIHAVLVSERASDACNHIREVLKTQNESVKSIAQLCELARLPSTHFFTSGRDFDQISKALQRAAEDSDGLFAHAAFTGACGDLCSTGVQRLIEYRRAAGKDLTGLASQVEALAARTLARKVYAEHGVTLGRFLGAKLDELRASLARKDREIVQLARKKLQRQVFDGARPPRGVGAGRKSTWTEMALIENEVGKQKRFISVRDLTERSGKALQELKPCWMMSPLAVAQYVQKGALSFDLCIVDEASQMPPEAAIGALLRCKQTVIVGDTNQLPPSSFFKKMIEDEEVDEDDAVLNESILEMANATFRPSRRLRWHYRSRHSGLIQFSNRMVYGDGLVVFPSATESMSRMGVEFKSVDGLYKAGTNPIEARAIVDAILDFMRSDADRSLGVVTLNQKQRDLISEEFEYALGQDPVAQRYVDKWRKENDGLEEFFIKNLENVQGDERDVIFIGTVYGPELKDARVMQRFGPINGVAGKRRLNVLFSRAKEKIVTFSSMSSSDVLAEENGNAGVYMLKRWLEYSATGLLDSGIATLREPDFDFEAFVIDQIKSMGLQPVSQVGVAGYFIDIGVRHPSWPHGYVLGVECDGASYHSAKSARDRDRLRQEILENLGWRLHRIWSTDWFNNPRREAERLRTVIEQRMQEMRAVEAELKLSIDVSESAATDSQTSNERRAADVLDAENPHSAAGPYIEIGDTVRVRYLTDDRKTLQVTIGRMRNDTANGIIHYETPMAKALLGAEVGDEVEVLVGSYVRSALVEAIFKASMGEVAQ